MELSWSVLRRRLNLAASSFIVPSVASSFSIWLIIEGLQFCYSRFNKYGALVYCGANVLKVCCCCSRFIDYVPNMYHVHDLSHCLGAFCSNKCVSLPSFCSWASFWIYLWIRFDVLLLLGLQYHSTHPICLLFLPSTRNLTSAPGSHLAHFHLTWDVCPHINPNISSCLFSLTSHDMLSGFHNLFLFPTYWLVMVRALMKDIM